MSCQRLLTGLAAILLIAASPGLSRAERVEAQGVVAELTVRSPQGQDAPAAREGETATLELTLRDAASAQPLPGLRPSAWLDRRLGDEQPGDDLCHRKVQSFLQGSLAARPSVDLGTYLVVVLNADGTISVIDPLLGFGGSKLLTLVELPAPGEAWALTRHGTLVVTMPKAGKVAVIDTNTWRIRAQVAVGGRPGPVALGADERYAWVAAGGAKDGALVAIDLDTLTVAARVDVGAGPYDLAIDPDDRRVWVTAGGAKAVTVVDGRSFKLIRRLPLPGAPTSIAISSASRDAYVAIHESPALLVLGAESQAEVARIAVPAGIDLIRFAPGGRFGFALATTRDATAVIDASTNRLLATPEGPPAPSQVTFTAQYAYVRSATSERVGMIALAALGKPDSVPVLTFAAGEYGDLGATPAAVASTMAPIPEGNGVLVTSPGDESVYYYVEGMAAPMGTFTNYNRKGRATLIVDRGLRETTPGVYTATATLPGRGTYDLAVYLGSPRFLHCFTVEVAANPKNPRRAGPTLAVEALATPTVVPNAPLAISVRATDPESGEAVKDLRDLEAQAVLVPGTWHQRVTAKPATDGTYLVEFTPPSAGVYYVSFACPSRALALNNLQPVILRSAHPAVAEKAEPGS